MKNILFFVLFLFMSGLTSIAQDVTGNYFISDNTSDTVMVSWGSRFGKVGLIQPDLPLNASVQRKRAYENAPSHVGVGNFIFDIRARFARDTVSCASHDGVFGLNLSILRSRVFVGYQYTNSQWFVAPRIGFEVIRTPEGVYKNAGRLFSRNVPFAGLEFGFYNRHLHIHSLVEYGVQFGWYGSGVGALRVQQSHLEYRVGMQYDGLWGYGWYGGVLYRSVLMYVSTFQGQFEFQEQRFPEQSFEMSRGFALGFQVNFR